MDAPGSHFASAVARGDYAAALKALDEAIDQGTDERASLTARLAQMHVNRGVCHQRLHLNRKALKDFDAALELAPNHAAAALRKGQALAALGRGDEARAVWRSAATAADASSDVEALAALAEALAGAGGGAGDEVEANAAAAPAGGKGEKAAAPPSSAAATAAAAPPAAAPSPSPAAAAPVHHVHASSSAAKSAAATAAAAAAAASGGSKPKTTPSAATAAAKKPTAAAAAAQTAPPTTATTTAPPATPQHPHPMLAPDPAAVNIAVMQINAGRIDEATRLLDAVLAAHPRELAALVARGTARALRRDLAGAEADFSRAIDVEPRYPDAWRRRAQARSAMGDSEGAAADFGRCAELLPRYAELFDERERALEDEEEEAALEEEARRRRDGGGSGGGGGGRGGGRGGRGGAAAGRPRRAPSSSDYDYDEAEEEGRGLGLAGKSAAAPPPPSLSRARSGGAASSSSSAAPGQTGDAADDAEEDLERAALLGAPDPVSAQVAECHMERGMLLQRARDYRRAAEAFESAAKAAPRSPAAWNHLGLCRTSLGELREGAEAYRRAVSLRPGLREAWANLAQCLKEWGRVEEAEAAFAAVERIAPWRLRAHMRQLRGDHDGAAALLDAAVAIARPSDPALLEALFLRAACHHARGRVREAIRDYDACLVWSPPPEKGAGAASPPPPPAVHLSEDAVACRNLAFYQRELAIYLFWRRLDRRSDSFSLDAEAPPLLKELWCKKGPVTPALASTYTPQPAPPPAAAAGAPALPPPLPPSLLPQAQTLARAADAAGLLLQNRHRGFLSNARQQRAAGLAALELAQRLRRVAAARRGGTEFTVPDGGSSAARYNPYVAGAWAADVRADAAAAAAAAAAASSSSSRRGSSSSSGARRRSSSPSPSSPTAAAPAPTKPQARHPYGWRDALDALVRWRQLCEPNDQAVWVDRLTRREFESGFGSHTPMHSGQTGCVRYAMNRGRAMERLRKAALEAADAAAANGGKGGAAAPRPALAAALAPGESAVAAGPGVWDAAGRRVPLEREAVAAAKTLGEMYEALGGEDAWVVLPLASRQRRGAESEAEAAAAAAPLLEGTRLTLVRVRGQPDGYEFSIRTPVTPSRWAAFDAELEAAWEALVDALAAVVGGKGGGGDGKSGGDGGGNDSSGGPLYAVARAALTFAYYWYNFMPLARGTAACGHTFVLGAMWAAAAELEDAARGGGGARGGGNNDDANFAVRGLPTAVLGPIPPDTQMDWEAILSPDPESFIALVEGWLLLPAPAPAAPPAGARRASLKALRDRLARQYAEPGGGGDGAEVVKGGPGARADAVLAEVEADSERRAKEAGATQGAAAASAPPPLPEVSEAIATVGARVGTLNLPASSS